MKTIKKKINKTLKVNFRATPEGEVKVTLPDQSAGVVYLEFKGKVIRQWDLKIKGDTLKLERVA